MSLLVVDCKLAPKDHPRLSTFVDELYWNTFSEQQLKDKLAMMRQSKVKSGSLIVRDNDSKEFKQLKFNTKQIGDFETCEAKVIARKNSAEGAPRMTFDEKCGILIGFVTEEDRLPTTKDEVDGFNIGKFYNSIVKQCNKYMAVMNQLEGDGEEEISEGLDNDGDDENMVV